MEARVVVITGAFGVLGRALVDAALAANYRVVAIDFNIDTPIDFPKQAFVIGGVDLSNPDAAATAIAEAAEHWGQLDVLLNVAGGFTWQTVEAGDAATWDRLHRMNVMTTLNSSRAALPFLGKSPAGRIINVGANAAVHANAGMGAYAASKAGVHRLTESLAAELKGRRITVNAVLPSIIDTPANRRDMPDADFAAWVPPASLAAVMIFLASPEAQAVTGALIPVSGGL
ncbi:MAG TPA: SDR family NAD(P)-dependent oxidoreductase [Caulobacteraceae bacterium]|nr:SDR family NAD(P)-dependent oxidoreductase [Caulobacteraceae bacterium]